MPDTLYPPPSVIESWPKPNYVDPQSRGPGLIYLCSIFGLIGIFVVSSRLYSRLVITKGFGLDDILIVTSLCFTIALSALTVSDNKNHGNGYHIYDIRPADLSGHHLNTWCAQWCYMVATCSVKTSILLFYRRLSFKCTRPFYIATWVGIIYNFAYMLGFCLVLLLECTPVNAYWMRMNQQWTKTHNFKCASESVSLPMSGALSVISDFYGAVLPIFVIYGLQMPRKQKWSLYGLFAVGFLVVGAGIARTIAVNNVINVDYDVTWALWEHWIWTMVELYLAILAASAPALKPLFMRYIRGSTQTATYESWQRNTSAANIYNKKHPMDFFHARGWSLHSSRRGSDFLKDIESIGIAHGGAGSTKSREESFVREVNNHDLETRHFELRASQDGKIVPMQIWKKNNPSSISVRELNRSTEKQALGLSRTASWPTAPTAIYRADDLQLRHSQPPKGHTKNFSHPRVPEFKDLPEPKKPQGSVTAAKLRAFAQTNKQRTRSDHNLPPPALNFDPTNDRSTAVALEINGYDNSEEDSTRKKKRSRSRGPVALPSRSWNGSDETLHLPRMGTKVYDDELPIAKRKESGKHKSRSKSRD